MSDQSGHGNSILAAGNYKLEKFVMYSLINGKEIDLKNLFRYIEIYEDIFSPYLSAKLHMEDAFNFPERFPIVGHEKIEISFKSDINAFAPVQLLFRVYKLDTQQISDTGKTQQYVLHLMSEGGYFNFSDYCGYAMSGTVSDMVAGIFKKHFPEGVWKDKLQIEPTKDNYSFVLPSAYTPFKAINWLTAKAYTKAGNEYSPFLFYETLDGYRFASLSSIIDQGSANPITYLHTTANAGIAEGQLQDLGFKSSLPSRYHKIQRLEEMSRFDAANNIMNGIVSSRLVVHDLVRKEQRISDLFEPAIFDSIKKLGTEPHFRKADPESKRMFDRGAAYSYLPSTPYTVHSKSNGIVDNSKIESVYLKRKYHMNAFMTQKIMIEIFGDSRRRVGDVVHIKVPKPQSDVAVLTDMDDKNLSGEYLVTSVKHTIGTAYSCKLELSRNCMGV